MFYPWTRLLPHDVELCAIQLPGREERIIQAPLSHISAVLVALREHLEPLLDRPFVFFGHSKGALIAFEVARQLRRERAPLPQRLVVAGRDAPHLPQAGPLIHNLPHEQFVEELRRLNGTPDEVLQNPEFMALLAPGLRADFALVETYVYREESPLSVPISAYGGEQDSEVAPEDLAAWSRETTAGLRLSMFPGDHFFIHSSRELVLGELNRELRAILDRPISPV